MQLTTHITEDQIEAIIAMFELEMKPEILEWVRTEYQTYNDVWKFIYVLIEGQDDRPYIICLLDSDDMDLPPIRVGMAAEMKTLPQLQGVTWTKGPITQK